jgi:integrase
MTTNLSLSFRSKDKCFSLCATIKGTSKRNYKEVPNLINPNFHRWDKKQQLFVEPTEDAIHNNGVLREMKERYQRLIDMFNPSTGKELWQLHDAAVNVEAKLEPKTLREFLSELISKFRNNPDGVPSRNFQVYITLLHKLEIEGGMLNFPVSDIDDVYFEKFGNFIREKLEGKNYVNLMKYFHSTIEKARQKKLTKHVLDYKYMDYVPKSKANFDKQRKGRDTLTKSEYEKFINMDLSIIPQSGKSPEYYKELYRDFCIFMYEMKIRPCDLVRLHEDDITEGIMRIYNKKKMNYRDTQKALQENRLTETAKKIIRKYKGKSSKGYIFPFSMNEYDWDIYKAESFNKWNNRKGKIQEDINQFLSKVKKELNVKELTLYTFRHSIFTHEIKDGKKNIMITAKEGGTSVKMLENNYFHYIDKKF